MGQVMLFGALQDTLLAVAWLPNRFENNSKYQHTTLAKIKIIKNAKIKINKTVNLTSYTTVTWLQTPLLKKYSGYLRCQIYWDVIGNTTGRQVLNNQHLNGINCEHNRKTSAQQSTMTFFSSFHTYILWQMGNTVYTVITGSAIPIVRALWQEMRRGC